MKITDFKCYFKGTKLQADAFGNNVAFACPECNYPVLAIARKYQRGMLNAKNPSKCRDKRCGQEYRIKINEKAKKITIQSVE